MMWSEYDLKKITWSHPSEKGRVLAFSLMPIWITCCSLLVGMTPYKLEIYMGQFVFSCSLDRLLLNEENNLDILFAIFILLNCAIW